MFRRISIATRLACAAGLFLVPVGYGVWTGVVSLNDRIARSRVELDGAAYLRTIDSVHAALSHGIVTNRPIDGVELAKRLEPLRQSHGAAMGVTDLAQELEALLISKERTAVRTETRRTLRQIARHVHARSGILLDPQIAPLALGSIFASQLADLREQVIDLRQRPARSAGTSARPLDVSVYAGRIGAMLNAIADDVATAGGPLGDPALKGPLEAVYKPFADAMENFQLVLETEGADPAAMDPALEAADHFSQAVSAQFTALLSQRIAAAEQERISFILVSAALSLVAFLAVVILVRIGVIVPLRQMTGALRRLANGDMTTQVPAARFKDETAELADAMRRFKAALEESRALSQSVVEATLQVSVATDQAASTISRISDGVQAETESVARLRQSFHETQEAMGQVGALTADGRERSRTAAERLSESLADIDAMAGAVRAIAGMSQEINRVTLAIGKLAAHSNILSLNASIEASRAGDHGRGFSVVAVSVGTLAHQTLALAKEIADLARRTDDHIGHGLRMAAEVERRMREVSEGIGDTDRLAGDIVAEMTRRQEDFARVEAALGELSRISQANAAASAEIATTMNGLASLTDDTRKRAEMTLARGDEAAG